MPADCHLDHIPERLHWKTSSELIEEFAVGDILYRRVSKDQMENPFGHISLVDLSHNIGINFGEKISRKEDVLYSIREDEGILKYSLEVIDLMVKSLDNKHQYNKTFQDTRNAQLNAGMRLCHQPENCMFPHCVFQIFVSNPIEISELEVTFENYKNTLGSNKFKRIRTNLRQELAKMIIRRSISFEDLD